jgi:hypothetical protein
MALLGSGEVDVGQQAIIQLTQVLPRAPAFTPKEEGRGNGGPYAKQPCPCRRGERAKGRMRESLGGERHVFLSLIHSFHGHNSDTSPKGKRK